MKFYRYNAVFYGSVDEFGEPTSSYPSPTLECAEFELMKETPKGYWIGRFGHKEKWISKTSRKRFAYPTAGEALEGFIKRTARRIEILTAQLDSSKTALSIAKRKAESKCKSLSTNLSPTSFGRLPGG